MHNKLCTKLFGAVFISFLSFSLFAISTAPHGAAAGLKSSGSQAAAGAQKALPLPSTSAFQRGMTQGILDGRIQCAEGLKQPGALQSKPVPGFNEGYLQGLNTGFQSCKQAMATAPRAFQQGMTQGIQDGRLQCAEGLMQPEVRQTNPATGFNEGYSQGLQAGFSQSCPAAIQ
ncbi:hypothetical protein Krac_3171 [Ktedonobacter racemifer DSM 44963]|uniref:Uncharacterized protein n=1 Tax=Ktedonobacter racemifer DSM 44963 TaxID=485913 RepID=D6U0M2_KTERA|nr:hypothetical protein Krac_3171 [Ktedonobacter racemifer DSM 44963]